MLKLFYIALGGAIGALMRYGFSGLIHRSYKGIFPLGTLSVNLLGSFIIGLVWCWSETVFVSQNMRVFIMIGVLGAFTTFSTFNLENFNLIRDGEAGLALVNLVISNVLGIGFVFAGYFSLKILGFIFK